MCAQCIHAWSSPVIRYEAFTVACAEWEGDILCVICILSQLGSPASRVRCAFRCRNTALRHTQHKTCLLLLPESYEGWTDKTPSHDYGTPCSVRIHRNSAQQAGMAEVRSRQSSWRRFVYR